MSVLMTAGYKAHTRARSTGTVVILCDSEAQGLDPVTEGGKYLLICEGSKTVSHGGCLNLDNSSDARYFMRHPEEWCPYCQGDPVQ